MDIQDLVSVEEAAKILGYRKSSVALLCRQGKLEGAFRIGHQWLIPRTTIENYEKGPQGFAAIWKRRREAEIAADEEIAEARTAIKVLGGEIKEKKTFELADSGERTIILIKKISSTPAKYPRPSAKIAKFPLK